MAYYPDFKHLMTTPQYGFLRTEPRLGRRIMLLGLGGSYAYGTNNENSDIDFRGITLNMPSDLIGLTEFEQYEDSGTDTVIYSFNKMVKLLLECNPNTCEILGLDHDQYLIKSRLGQELLDNRNLFLSKRAAKSFGGYASAQLRRLQNAIARDSMPQTERERHIFNSVKHALEDFERRFADFDKGSIRLYIDKAENPLLETEGLGGSYAYGTNNENSDIDFRGITLNMPSDLIGLTEFEQYEDSGTDTVIYSFNKMVKLLLECNPNTCEILGLDHDQYLIKSRLGQELLDNRNLFLSKRAAKSFGGYASAQLRRLQNAIARDSMPQTERERHIFNSVKHALEDFERRFADFDKGSIRLYIDKAENPLLETEIFVDAHYRHMPLRDYENMWSIMHSVVKDYDKIGKRNKKKDDNHLNKHAMHLIRLFMMAVDILEKGEIRTNRKSDLNLLLRIRAGGFQKEDGTFDSEFYDILRDYEERLEMATKNTTLPDNPDMEKVEAFVEYVNRKAIEGDY